MAGKGKKKTSCEGKGLAGDQEKEQLIGRGGLGLRSAAFARAGEKVLQFGKVFAFSLAHKRCFLGHKSIRVLAMAVVERHNG